MFVRNGEKLGSVKADSSSEEQGGAPASEEPKQPEEPDPSPEPAPHNPPVTPESQPEPPPQPPSLDDLLARSEHGG